jgi:hypothetical protein
LELLGKILISSEGQWSQGIIWDGANYYVSFHSSKAHNSGNVTINIYDASWTLKSSTAVTSFPSYNPTTSTPPLNTQQFNANRPCLTKVGTKLYVAYDVGTYTLTAYGSWQGIYNFGKEWQARVNAYQINPVGLDENEALSSMVKMYPNPSFDNLYLQPLITEENYIIEIHDLSGKLIYTSPMSLIEKNEKNLHKISLKNFSSGVYNLKIKGSKGIQSEKISIAK